MEQMVMQLLKEGNQSLPTVFIKYYKEMGLNDQEMMLIVQILTFKQEGKDFPTIGELKDRMTADEREIIMMLQKLIQKGYLAIDDHIEKDTGVRAEIYQVDPLYEKIASIITAKHASSQKENRKLEPKQNLFTIFEQEFGRPLSPIECETIAMWQDQDQYKDELIVAALREAVISNKLFIRYIDRILYEWQRNQIHTAQQAREFSLKFRRAQAPSAPKKVESFPFYNWLEN